jgi:hypothetical protein
MTTIITMPGGRTRLTAAPGLASCAVTCVFGAVGSPGTKVDELGDALSGPATGPRLAEAKATAGSGAAGT